MHRADVCFRVNPRNPQGKPWNLEVRAVRRHTHRDNARMYVLRPLKGACVMPSICTYTCIRDACTFTITCTCMPDYGNFMRPPRRLLSDWLRFGSLSVATSSASTFIIHDFYINGKSTFGIQVGNVGRDTEPESGLFRYSYCGGSKCP